MPVFSYQAREAGTGREVEGTIDASSEQTAVVALRGRNLFVLKISERGRASAGSGSHRGVKLIDLAAFTRQLSSMLDAGLTITQALQTLADQTGSQKLGKVIRDLIQQIDAGESLSGALQRHPDVFDRLYINMVNAGERGGILPEILSRLATHSERTQKIQSKVRGALMYPSVVTVVAIAVTCFLMVQVVPTFSQIFKEQGASLPAFTQLVISIADTLKANLLWISLAVFGVVAGSFLFVRTPGGRAWWDAQKLKLPIVGPIFHKLALTRFARTTASLLHSGVPILETLNVVAISVGNLKMEDALKEIAVKIEQGETLSGAMSQYPIFPRIILRMVMAGEQGGAVDTMLEKIADYMDDELEHTLSGLTSLIEPLLIIFLGVMIGGMVLAMFLPVFDLVNQVR